MAQKGSDDALGGLLAFSGLDTSAFNRPKSLAGMKSSTARQATPVQASSRAPPASPPRPSPLGAAQKPPPSPDPLSLDALESLVKSASRSSL